MKKIIYLFTLILIGSCQKSEQTENNDDSFECTNEEIVYVDDLCQWYSENIVIVDDPFDNNCIQLIGLIGHIKPKESRVDITIGETHSDFCSSIDYTGNVDCSFSGDVYKNNLNLLASLRPGDIIEVKGKFEHTYSGISNASLDISPNEISQSFGSIYAHCGILGKQWSIDVLGYINEWYFLNYENEHFVYVRTTIDRNVFIKPAYSFVINNDCSEIELTGIRLNPGEKIKYKIEKINNDELVLSNNSKKMQFYHN